MACASASLLSTHLDSVTTSTTSTRESTPVHLPQHSPTVLCHPNPLVPCKHPQLQFCSFSEIVGFLERQYDDILAEESRIKRNPRFRDNRVHALLYFITPTGHSLREMDIELMRRLSPRVNVIPVLGKADTMTLSERQAFKKRVSVYGGTTSDRSRK